MDDSQQKLHAEMARHHWWFRGRRRILRSLIESLLPPDPETLIVDVGCGPGTNVGAFYGDYAAAGLDPSETAVEIARGRFPEARFLATEIGNAPKDFDNGARLYLLMDVLEHVPDDHLLLSTVLSRSEPGALVLITVPALWPLWSHHDVALGHYRRYDRRRLESTWRGLPVSVELVSFFNSRLYPLIRFIRWIARGLGSSAGRRGTDLWLPPKVVNRSLENLFAGESNRLNRCLGAKNGMPYVTGTSMIAILRLDEATVEPRSKPDDLEPDFELTSMAT